MPFLKKESQIFLQLGVAFEGTREDGPSGEFINNIINMSNA